MGHVHDPVLEQAQPRELRPCVEHRLVLGVESAGHDPHA